jgi:hypothetical protein
VRPLLDLQQANQLVKALVAVSSVNEQGRLASQRANRDRSQKGQANASIAPAKMICTLEPEQ